MGNTNENKDRSIIITLYAKKNVDLSDIIKCLKKNF